MKTATVREAQHDLSKLLVAVEAGEEVVITRRGRPVAKLVHDSGTVVKPPRLKVDWGESIRRRNEALGDLPRMKRNIVLEMREDERY